MIPTKEIIEHQFLNEDYFLPNWKIETLVLGTFNPNCGERTDYFYGRCRNNFWRIIENLCRIEYMSLQNNFQGKMYIMKIHKFGCTDVIESIKRQSTVDQIEFCGSGYSDQALFNQTKCKITYSFQEIKEYLIKNNVKTVINTWGKRNNPREFRESIDDFESFCSNENINFIRQCPSPSGRLRGKENKQILTKFYKTHLLQPCP
ncbi:MAG TPA: hypothetical protein VGA80_08060 [Flavobacteriaceae bacterium]|jgi:G:T/U-mismatch repair DNA glycosylase